MSIHRRKGKNGYSYQVKYRRENQMQGARSFTTKKAADRFQASLTLDDGDLKGLSSKERKTTFGECATAWQQTMHDQHALVTKIRRDQILRLHLIPTLGSMPIRSIKNAHLRELISKWRNQGLSPQTIRNHISIARPIFKLAITDGLIFKDPTSDLKLGPATSGIGTILDSDQCDTLLVNLDDHHRRLFYTLLVTGIRISELFNLEVSHVDFTNKLLLIRKSKTINGVRDISLSDNDLTVLQEQIESLGKDGSKPNSTLFRSPEGQKLQYRNLSQRVLKKVIKKTGLPEFTFHDLRKTHATMLVAAGIDPKTIQQRMGHASIETTLKYYAQATKENQRKAAHVGIDFLTKVASSNLALTQ